MKNIKKILKVSIFILLPFIVCFIIIFLYNSNKIDNGGGLAPEKAQFNVRWENYSGKQIGSSVRSLIQQINNYNKNVNDGRYILLEINNINPNNINEPLEYENLVIDNTKITYRDVKAGMSYDIKLYYTSEGYVSKIYIQSSETTDFTACSNY